MGKDGRDETAGTEYVSEVPSISSAVICTYVHISRASKLRAAAPSFSFPHVKSPLPIPQTS
ncbi:hypothetical protein JMJ77_0005573, partial [Colletotrichum scovillei]